MRRRIFGLENEYGVTCRITGEGKLSPDEVARYLFRRVVSWGRSSNVFLTNGARLYLDVGSHPEYATPECDSVRELIIHDRAGERILEDLAVEAQERIDDEGIEGQIYLFKNNTDSAGNSYGCHENYLIGRSGEFSTFADIFIPFLISRQIVTGAGKVLPSARGSSYCVSQRAEHIWEGLSSATTRSRPIINTRDEPHADAELYRRLHVIVGDSNMSECTNMLKVGSAELVLQMIEAGVAFRDMSLENSIRAIREISSDTSGTQTVKLASGLDVTALDMQEEYFSKAATFVVKEGINDPNTRLVMDLWGRSLQAIRSQNLQDIGTEIDWVIKKLLMERFMERDSLDWNSPRLAQLDLAYHDINRRRGLFYLLERKGLARRLLNDSEIEVAKALPPQSTRAKLRGDFISAAQEKKRDFTVDWVHLKLNDQAQRTVLCKDPFLAVDERVDRLIASM